jgi:hypothetical protein
MHLPDPRRYPPPNARNPLIRLVMKQLTAPTHETGSEAAAALRQGLHDMIEARDHAGLNAVLTQSPALEAAQTLWQALRDILEEPAAGSLFLIPVILVAGVKGSATLPGELGDPQAIVELLRQHGVFPVDAKITLHSVLASEETLAGISPYQILHWQEEAFVPPPAAMPLRDEAVFLRFLVGTSSTRPVSRMGAWGFPLAELIGQQLATAGVTLFTIPRSPQGCLSALESGRKTLLETRLQHMTSNAVRGIRLKGRTPVATLAAHDNDEIRITISSKEDGERWQGFVWPLGPRDEVPAIEQFATELFSECQITDIRIVEDLQPDLQGDLPFFVTAHDAPVQIY